MADTARLPKEGVGEAFLLPAMIAARDRTFDAVRKIADAIRPGMNEVEAHTLADEILAGIGMEHLWHKNVIRFGKGTTCTFHDPVDPERVLGANDIFFVDLGVVWGGHEGDAGDTFVTGDDPEMAACAEAARTLWHEVAARWRKDGLTGEQLYAWGVERAKAMGWVLNWGVKGHRVSDFPHAIYKAGSLGDFEGCPATGIWVLEIQLEHPTRGFGAFYEDLLIETAS